MTPEEISKILKDPNFAGLQGADLRGAHLQDAHLQGADLRGTDLRGADLRGAHLRVAYLQGAHLQGANLQGANLRGAYLRVAYLQGADLQGADLQGADLQGAYLQGAYLQGAKDIPPYVIAATNIIPEGTIIGYKKCRNNIIIKLQVDATTKRCNATGRKCRAERVTVLEGTGVSQYDSQVIYEPGKVVIAPNWCDDCWQTCAGGIHFFITRYEAEQWEM